MDKRKQYGFTLIEVLAVIVILGIISGIAVGGYSTYVKKARNNYYKAQEDMLTQAGRDFFTDNRGKLPQATGEESCVLLSTLVSNKYIDKVLDYNKKSCSQTGSKVCARKLSTRKYLYYSYLDCGAAYGTEEYENPTLSFSLAENQTATNEENEDYPLTMTISDEANASKNNAGIASYRYVIYREDRNNLVYYDSMWKSYKDQTKTERTVTINLDSSGTYYVKGWAYNRSGKLVTEISGKVTLSYILDCQNQIDFDSSDYVDGSWSNKNIDVNISKSGAVDSFDVKLENQTTATNKSSEDIVTNHNTREKLTTITKNGISVLKITCHDSLGNTGEASSSNYMIDKVKPICPHMDYVPNKGKSESDWVNSNLKLTAYCQDIGGDSSYISGCNQSTVSATISSSSKIPQYGIDIVDKAGNSNTCQTGVYIDKEGPEITFKVYDTANPAANPLYTFTNQNKNMTSDPIDFAYIKLSITDEYSDIASYTMSYSTPAPNSSAVLEKNGTSSLSESDPDSLIVYSSAGTFTINITAQDKAGNTSTAQLKVKVELPDETKPKITVNCVKKMSCTDVTSIPTPNNGTYTSGTWSKDCVFCRATSSDDVTFERQVCGATANSSYNISQCLSFSSGSYRNVNANGNSKVVFKATKNSNNKTATSSYIVNIDKVNPTLTIKMTKRDDVDATPSSTDPTYTNNTWSNKYVTLFATTTDAHSGVASGYPKYYIKSGSATGAGTDTQGSWRNGSERIVNAQGISYVKFKSQDNAGNSKETSYYTIKLDHSKPTLSVSVSNNKITFKAKDSISGIKDYCIKTENGDCSADDGYVPVTNSAGVEYSKSGITKITTSAKSTLKPGTKYTVVVRDQAGNTTSKTVSTSLTFTKIETWNDRYCTFHNGGASASGGSSTKSCSQAVDNGTNCWTKGYNTNNHGDKTYANMKIDELTAKISGNDLLVSIKFTIWNGYFGTYSNGYNRYMCLKKNNRTFTNAECTSDTQKVVTNWGGNGKSTTISKTFTIKDYNSKSGSYSFKMWGDTYKTSCSSNVNALDQIYSFQTDYIFKLS